MDGKSSRSQRGKPPQIGHADLALTSKTAQAHVQHHMSLYPISNSSAAKQLPGCAAASLLQQTFDVSLNFSSRLQFQACR